MDTDPGIVCFQHCSLGKMFCLGLPDSCPLCGALLATAHFTLLPFRVPYPFVRATQHPCSIVIRPSTGDFLNDYPSCKDLHIAVTSANGQVVEFDSAGLQHGRTDMWQQCLVVKGPPGPGLSIGTALSRKFLYRAAGPNRGTKRTTSTATVLCWSSYRD